MCKYQELISTEEQSIKRINLRKRAAELLSIISAEFETDPMSVQCFDLRIVQETKEVTEKLRLLDE